MTDPLVEEVRATREKIAEQFGFDLEKIGRHYIRLQQEQPEGVVRRREKVEEKGDSHQIWES